MTSARIHQGTGLSPLLPSDLPLPRERERVGERALRHLSALVITAASITLSTVPSACRATPDPAPTVAEATPVARIQSALTNADVFGFEDLAGWALQPGAAPGATLTRSTTHDQGSFSLQLSPSPTSSNHPIISIPLSTVTGVSSQLAFDIMLPPLAQQPNPTFFGTAQLFIDCPSRSIFNAFLAQVPLTGLPLATWATLTFPVANNIVSGLLMPGYTDLRITVVLALPTPPKGGVYRLDNLLFVPNASNQCSGRPNGTACTDNSACTTSDTCLNGTCTGTTVTCTAPGPCQTVGACNPASGCPAPVNRPNGTTCSDANACTTGEACQGGVCTGGTAVACTAGQCQIAGTCIPASGCPAPTNRPNGSACNDANACTTGDSCQTGACTGAPLTCTAGQCQIAGTCNPASGCPAPTSRPNGTACNDANACITGEACQGGACAGGSPVTCTAGQCQIAGTCIPATGCPAPTSRPNGTACNDANACTTSEACQGGTCAGGSPVTCTAGQCQIAGTCIPATGCPAPTSRPNGTTCNDANACTTGEACQGGTCAGGSPVTCTAGQCQIAGTCIPATGCPAATSKPNGTACDDANACTLADRCEAGACTGDDKECTVPNACFLPGTCDPATGSCSDSTRRPAGTSPITGFAYDGAGRQTRDGDADLIFDAYDQLREVRPRPGVAMPKFNDGKPVVAERHGYGYDGMRTSTTAAPETAQAKTQYWFSDDYTERDDGRRDHYLRVGDRVVARVSKTPPASGGGVAAANRRERGPTRLASSSLTGPAEPPLAMLLFVALCLTSLGAAFWTRLRNRQWRATIATMLIAPIASVSCQMHGGTKQVALNPWPVAETIFFHQAIAAGPTLMTANGGSVFDERRYEPFGVPLDAQQQGVQSSDVDFAREPQNILGKQTDPGTGWSYHGARWMMPQSARWVSPDPATRGPSPQFMERPWDLNPYAFAWQNPILLQDRNGLWPTPVLGPAAALGRFFANPKTINPKAHTTINVVDISGDRRLLIYRDHIAHEIATAFDQVSKGKVRVSSTKDLPEKSPADRKAHTLYLVDPENNPTALRVAENRHNLLPETIRGTNDLLARDRGVTIIEKRLSFLPVTNRLALMDDKTLSRDDKAIYDIIADALGNHANHEVGHQFGTGSADKDHKTGGVMESPTPLQPSYFTPSFRRIVIPKL